MHSMHWCIHFCDGSFLVCVILPLLFYFITTSEWDFDTKVVKCKFAILGGLLLFVLYCSLDIVNVHFLLRKYGKNSGSVLVFLVDFWVPTSLISFN